MRYLIAVWALAVFATFLIGAGGFPVAVTGIMHIAAVVTAAGSMPRRADVWAGLLCLSGLASFSFVLAEFGVRTGSFALFLTGVCIIPVLLAAVDCIALFHRTGRIKWGGILNQPVFLSG